MLFKLQRPTFYGFFLGSMYNAVSVVVQSQPAFISRGNVTLNSVLEKPLVRLTSKVFKRIEEIPEAAWRGVFPSVLENYTYFKALDESGFEQFSFRYILVYEAGEVVGATSCFFMKYPLDTTVQGWLRTLMLSVKKIFPNAFTLHALICGLPMDQGRVGIKSDRPQEVLQEIVECMERLAKENRVGILAFKDFNSSYQDSLGHLEAQGFSRFQNLPSTAMHLPFDNFDGYFKTLSKSSREGLRRKLKKIDSLPKLDLEITHRMSPEVLDQAYALFLQTVDQSEVQFEMVPKAFFDRVGENMPKETLFFLWRLEGKLLAFAYCMASKDYFIDLYLGFDYSVAHDKHLYFVRFRDLMNWCFEHKMRAYEMGPTSYEAKRRLGFEMIPIFVYAKHLNPLFNPIIRLLCRFLKPENYHEVFDDMGEEEEGGPCQKTE